MQISLMDFCVILIAFLKWCLISFEPFNLKHLKLETNCTIQKTRLSTMTLLWSDFTRGLCFAFIFWKCIPALKWVTFLNEVILLLRFDVLKIKRRITGQNLYKSWPVRARHCCILPLWSAQKTAPWRRAASPACQGRQSQTETTAPSNCSAWESLTGWTCVECETREGEKRKYVTYS